MVEFSININNNNNFYISYSCDDNTINSTNENIAVMAIKIIVIFVTAAIILLTAI